MLACSLAFLGASIASEPRAGLIGAALLASSNPIYRFITRRRD